jgi:hypothetical protein
MGLHQTKGLCTTKETVITQETVHRMGENLCSYLSNKGLISRIYRELKTLNHQRLNTPMKKWAYELNREFSKEESQTAGKLHEEVFNFPGYKRDVNQNNT